MLDLNGLPEFYADILKAWSEIKGECMPENHFQIREEILWNNKNITIAGTSIYYKDWHAVGIEKIKDLLNDENKFTSYQNLTQKVGKRFPFTKLLGLINAIPDSWKQKLMSQSMFNNDNDQHNTKASLTTKGITCKQSRSIFVNRKFKEPLANNRLRRLGVNELDKINEIHSLSFKMTKETKLSIFQFKIIHNILPHKVLLYEMKITDSDLCLYCGSQETLQHLLASCPLLRTFWSDVLTWWNSSSTCNMLFDEPKILYGYNSGDPSSGAR